MSDLWAEKRGFRREAVLPLAARLRPRTLEQFIGQRHILAPGKLLRRMIDADRLTSVIFTGPPGTGKTSLAEVIANHTDAHFERTHASAVGVKEIRQIIDAAIARLEAGPTDVSPPPGAPAHGRRTILFLDEIHRFARNQQDVLLDAVERGLITLIGATTENPYFSLNSALVSRSTIFRFDPLSDEEIAQLIRAAISDKRAFPQLDLVLDDDAVRLWSTKSDGDARRALSALEVAVLSETARTNRQPDEMNSTIHITLAIAEESIREKALVYDGTGDEHYDVVSAFIKSMRGGDPDAAVYWLARMLEAGEDPRFIARRIAILASEDIGNADPRAIQVAAAAWEVTERVGLPECQLTLAQAAIYMACAPKSNASAKAIWNAAAAVREGRTIEVPISLRDSHSTVARTSSTPGEAENVKPSDAQERKYLYPHDFADGFVVQEYLGVDRVFYQPTERGEEAAIGRRLQAWRERIRTARSGTHFTSPESDGAATNDK